MFVGPFSHSILKRAQDNKLLTIDFINIRDFGIGKHKVVDDKPYGGGEGMVLRVDVLHEALKKAKDKTFTPKEEKIILLSAKGKQFTHYKALSYAALSHLILLCGHYEGVDERILAFLDEEVSIGNFITTGGEIPAMLITDSVARLVKGVLDEKATRYESFSPALSETNDQNYLEYPHYTRPIVYQSLEVPKVLVSGNHEEVRKWRTSQTKPAPKHRNQV